MRLILGIMLALATFSQCLATNDTLKVRELVRTAYGLAYSKPDSAIGAVLHAVKILEEQPVSKQTELMMGRALYLLGQLYNTTGDYINALNQFNKSMVIAEKLNDAQGLGMNYSGLGAFYKDRGDIPTALTYHLKSYKINDSINDKKGVLLDDHHIGEIYLGMQKLDKAERCYREGLRIARELNDSVSMGLMFQNYAILHHLRHQFDSATAYYKRAFVIDSAQSNFIAMISTLNDLGDLHEQAKDHKNSMKCLQRALKISRDVGVTDYESNCLLNIAAIQLRTGDINSAEKNALAALEMAQKLNMKPLIAASEFTLSSIYEKKNELNKALQHYKVYFEVNNEFVNENISKKLETAELKFAFEKEKDKQRIEHAQTIHVYETQHKFDMMVKVTLVFFIGLAVLLLFFIKRAYDNKKRAYHIEKQAAEYLAKETQRKEILLQEVHHRINNNLQVISSLLDMQASGSNDPKLAEMLHQSQSRIESLSKVHEMLYRTETSDDVNIRTYIERILEFHRDVIRQRFPGVTLASDIDATTLPSRDAVALALIVNELVTNSCKHAFVENDSGRISVSFHELNGKWKLLVCDSGPGIVNPSREGGLGLRLINILARQLHATMNVFNRNGAVFELAFSH